MRYRFLIDTYETEALKVLSVWSMFDDADLRRRPNPTDPRGRNLLEHMLHQCMGENLWFEKMLGIAVTTQPAPAEETRAAFVRQYRADSLARLAALRVKDDAWWEEETAFFDARRTRAWIVTRRIAHTAHHRGQQTTLLRVFGRKLHSTYGPTADTGGLPRDGARTIYLGAADASLPLHAEKPVTERPDHPQP